MRNRSALFDELFENRSAIFEYRIEVLDNEGQVIYVFNNEKFQNTITWIDGTSGNDFFNFGNAYIGELEFTLDRDEIFQLRADDKLIFYFRLIDRENDIYSEWIKVNHYIVDKPPNLQMGTQTITYQCFDNMYLLDINTFLSDNMPITFPATYAQTAEYIKSVTGVTIDINVLGAEGIMLEIDFIDSNHTMREILSQMAITLGCNCRCSSDGVIKFYRLENITSNAVTTVPEWTYDRPQDRIAPITSIELIGGGEDEVYFSGDRKGRVVTVLCLWARQSIADNLLNYIYGYINVAVLLENSWVNPCIEPNDIVKGIADGEYYRISNIKASCTANIICDLYHAFWEQPEEITTRTNGRGSGDGTALIPKLYWDYNDNPITVFQNEVTIAQIEVDVTVAGNGRGAFLLTFMSDSNTEVILRLYDNGVQELFSPLFDPKLYPAQRGFNSIGFSLTYIKLLAGVHLFTVTAQARDGTLNIGTRAVMYSIDILAREFQPILYKIRDITISQPEFALEPIEIYGVAIEDNGDLTILRTRYILGRRISGNDLSEAFRIIGVNAKEAAIELDGVWKLFSGDRIYHLETKGSSWVPWINTDDELWVQKGNDTSTRVKLDTQCLKLSSSRWWNNEEFNIDNGLAIVYVKYNGEVWYVTLIGILTGAPTWQLPVRFLDKQGNPVFSNNIHAGRTNDFRRFILTDDKLYISDRTLVGQAIPNEYYNVGVESKHSLISNNIPNLVAFKIIDTNLFDDFTVEVTGNYPIYGTGKEPLTPWITSDIVIPIKNVYVNDSKLYIEFADSIKNRTIINFTIPIFNYFRFAIGFGYNYFPAMTFQYIVEWKEYFKEEYKVGIYSDCLPFDNRRAYIEELTAEKEIYKVGVYSDCLPFDNRKVWINELTADEEFYKVNVYSECLPFDNRRVIAHPV